MVLYSDILIGLPMEMKLCHMLVGKYLALHENRESRHVRGGFRKLRGPMDSCPKYILISMAKYKQGSDQVMGTVFMENEVQQVVLASGIRVTRKG